ncbi:hypothetical protein KR018_000726, partial [Drosophila ironensis]
IVYSTSVMSMVKLLEVEESLKNHIDVYIQEMQSKLDSIKQFRESIERDSFTKLEEREEYMANPLNSFPLLRRLNQDWPKWLRYLKMGIATKKIKAMELQLKDGPNDSDLQVALKGMSRIIKVYNQHAEDLTKGILLGRQFNAQLNAPDCVALGDFYYNHTQFTDSTHWYRMALRLHKHSHGKICDKALGLKRKLIYKKYAKAMIQEAMKLEETKATLENNPEIENMANQVAKEDNYENIKSLIDELLAGKEIIFPEEANKKKRKPSNLDVGCRGKWPKNAKSTLTCRYKSDTSDFLRLAPLKMEFINMEPLIVLYHDVLYEKEFRSMRDLALFNTTMSDGWTYVNFDKMGNPQRRDRVVKIATFEGTRAPFTLSINRRIADMTGLEMHDNMALHLANYGLGGHFSKHVDYVDLDKRPPHFFEDLWGDRTATALLYASDVPLGGATVFTKLKLTIEPKKGNALIWFNLDNAGNPDPRTMHSACPVVVGSRWTIFKWIHERQQLFKRPCYA